MQKQTGTLLQIGVGLFVIGIVVRILLAVTWSLLPLANLAIGAGLILAVVGLFTGASSKKFW
jgi:hypothetical protein